jgi:UDP-galactopyranose mutase
VLFGLDLKTTRGRRLPAEPRRAGRADHDLGGRGGVEGRRELYELFFQCYTRKQWGMDPSELDKSVTSRVPTRTNTDDRYFTDTFQYMPLHGYTRMFENMLDHDNIDVELGVDFRDVKADVRYEKLIFTGPIDEYFRPPLRQAAVPSLRFQHETLDQEQFQESAR